MRTNISEFNKHCQYGNHLFFIDTLIIPADFDSSFLNNCNLTYRGILFDFLRSFL